MVQTKSTISIQPLNDKVVIQPVKKEEMTASGILLPDSKKERAEMGTVVAVGPGAYIDGARVPMSVKVGDTVLFNTYEEPRTFEGSEYYIVSESNILAITK